MSKSLRPGDRVIADAQGGWKGGEVVEIYGRWPGRLYGVRFVTAVGNITAIYRRRSLRKLTGAKHK